MLRGRQTASANSDSGWMDGFERSLKGWVISDGERFWPQIQIPLLLAGGSCGAHAARVQCVCRVQLLASFLSQTSLLRLLSDGQGQVASQPRPATWFLSLSLLTRCLLAHLRRSSL